jgi:hypothetical protein
METNANTPAIIEPQNIQTVMRDAPAAFSENQVSHDRCLQAASALISRAEAEGMTEPLDQEIAVFISRARKTLDKMNSKRSAVTQIFDRIRSAYTALENDIDPSRKDTLPFRLQQCRNSYAAARRAEQEARQREQMRLRQIQAAKDIHRDRCKAELRQIADTLVRERTAQLRDIYAATTLATCELTLKHIQQFTDTIHPDTLSDHYFPRVAAIHIPESIPGSERLGIEKAVFEELHPDLLFQCSDIIRAEKQGLIDMIPSRRRELERIAQADAQEAERIRKEMQERDRIEAERREKEQADRQEKERAAAELAAKKSEMDSLFSAAQAGAPAYQPKTQVRKRIKVLNTEGFIEIVGMWWAHHGSALTMEELQKIFSKQITFCNKLANDKENPVLIKSQHITYEDDIKAK